MSESRLDSGSPWLSVHDKVAHLGLYLVLGGALAWARRQRAGGAIFHFLLLGMGYGALDEWHQSFVPGRDPSLGDWVADSVGVILGFFLLHYVLKMVPGAFGNDTKRKQ